MDGIAVGDIRFLCAAVDEVVLPRFKGNVFRGGFGHAFKALTCPAGPPPCPKCKQPQSCLYSYVFETPPPADTERMRKYPFAPHPFVIEPPETPETRFRPGDSLSFNLVLVGRALDYFSYFLLAFRELGNRGIGPARGRYRIERAEAIHTGQPQVVYSASDSLIRQLPPPLRFPVLAETDQSPSTSDGPLALEFVTQTRMKFGGRLDSSLEFHVLVRNLLRRASSMAYFHCGFELDMDFGGLIRESEQVRIKEQATRWVDWERYSTRQQESMKFGGMVGRVTYEGPWQKFLPLLKLGEVIHIGKNATFGLGKYLICKDLSHERATRR